MTLKQLEAFYWAATCASFALAAERVHVSISSLSKRISELEQSLEVTLFDRAGLRAVLTDAGHALLPRAQAMLEDAEAMRDMLRGAQGLHGTCRFGVGELTALTWLPGLVAYGRQHYPDLRLEPSVDAGSSLGALAQQVRDGALDFAIIAARSVDAGIRSEDVGEVHFKWVASPMLAARNVSVARVLDSGVPFVSLPAGTGTMRILDQWLADAALAPAHRLACNSWGVVAGLLVEGLGVGVLPDSWADPLMAHGDLVALKARSALPPLRYAFHCRRGDSRPVIASMLAAVRACVDFRQPGRWLQRPSRPRRAPQASRPRPLATPAP